MLVNRAEEFARLVSKNKVEEVKEFYLTLLDLGVVDEKILAASWLSKGLENTTTTYETLEIQFGEEIADLVQKVTNRRKISKNNPWITLAGKYEKDEQYEEIVKYIAEYRKELDEEMSKYYDDCYQVVEEKLYDQ